jgi:hypothetical protein
MNRKSKRSRKQKLRARRPALNLAQLIEAGLLTDESVERFERLSAALREASDAVQRLFVETQRRVGETIAAELPAMEEACELLRARWGEWLPLAESYGRPEIPAIRESLTQIETGLNAYRRAAAPAWPEELEG